MKIYQFYFRENVGNNATSQRIYVNLLVRLNVKI